MALDDDMTAPPEEPDSGTPTDRAEGTMREDQYLGKDSVADLEADGGAGDGGADSGAGDGGADSGAGGDDPTTEAEEDTRFA